MDSAEVCYNLRQQLREFEASLGEQPVDPSVSHGEWRLVGHGDAKNDLCGKFRSFYGCVRTELHNRITLDNEDYSGKAYVVKQFFSCDRPSCPRCYKFGYAVREGLRIEARLTEASKKFGLVEHIIVGLPPEDWELPYSELRSHAIKGLFRRGVLGGALVFHGFRYNRFRGWFWSAHFHVLGFVAGGYGKCRRCTKTFGGKQASKELCAGCNGFEARTRDFYESDGLIVKVKDERLSVYHTAWYELGHASIRVNVKRAHVATWWGCCSYRKLKVTVEVRQRICPLCKHDLVKLRYFGAKHFVVDRAAKDYIHASWEDLIEFGRVVWIEVDGG